MVSIRVGVAALAVVLGTAASAHQVNLNDTQRQLMRLEPGTRMEQRCNGRASGLTVREHRLKAPDEVVAYAFADDIVRGVHVDAPGAAIRDGGQWYHLSYHCEATSDGLGIVSFEYKLGASVPRKDWAAHSLVP